ncbi:signal peptidase I [bacterium]|nr:signal peptidase I [bacterium]
MDGHGKHWQHELLEWGKTIVLTVGIALALRTLVVEPFVVPSGSMRPTIVEGDHLLGTKFHYRFWAPRRGDVVVFRPPEEALKLAGNPVERYVKRVVAVAGDEVEIRRGRVFVNGEALTEPYIAEPPRYVLRTMTVPPGHVFVLGDNRNESLDSHRWGFLPEDALIAHVFACYWPLDRIHGL